ncbi:MAG TPA: glycoside hydrolase family 15 protein, partial [Pirellulales bacterium]|nr:glycoside hydrolase family 15 protein [Pirellulales bacterium]
VIGRRGEVRMAMRLVIRFDYGSIVPWVRKIEGGIEAVAGPDTLRLRTPIALRGEELATVAEFTVAEGQTAPFLLDWHPSHEPAPHVIDAASAVQSAECWWRDWASRCAYRGNWREAVLRSLIVLKSLTYAPTGGIVAAPTTSLPERLGGQRNWDYRFCWIRDASFTLQALLAGGYSQEASAWREWLVRAVAGNASQMNIMYGLRGERRLPELELPWLPGYENSAPVRVGNAAHQQFQLDVFGEVMAAAYVGRRSGMTAAPRAWDVNCHLLDFLESAWRQPDEGIWEVRGPRRHFTHSKVMAWVAFDRMIKCVEEFEGDGEVDRWRRLRAQIHDDVCRQGYNAKRGAFVQYYGAEQLDASLLMVPLVGFLPVDDPRVRGTIAAIERELTIEGFVARYPTESGVDGLPPGEGAFLPCTFWLASDLHLLGKREQAVRLFERLLALRNDVGLLSEEYDPRRKRLVGNFPQAFSHVALINTARRLDSQRQVA